MLLLLMKIENQTNCSMKILTEISGSAVVDYNGPFLNKGWWPQTQ